MPNKIKIIRQARAMDCGPICLKMIANYYGNKCSLNTLRKQCSINEKGTSLFSICKVAEALGMECYAVKINYYELDKRKVLPCIAIWKEKHYVIIEKIANKIISIVDPAVGYIKYPKKLFIMNWANRKRGNIKYGICIIIKDLKKVTNRAVG